MLRNIVLLLSGCVLLLTSAASFAARVILTLDTEHSIGAVQQSVQQSIQTAGNDHAVQLRHYAHLPQLLLLTLPDDSNIQFALAQYRRMPGIRSAELDIRVRKTVIPNDPLFNQQWHLSSGNGINATAAWDFTTGDAGQVIAVIDTGTDYTHPDLAANIWQHPGEIPDDGVDNDNNGYIDDVRGINPADGTVDPMDEDGHGTLVAGIIAAVTDNNTGVAGVNWQSKILPCRFMDSNGEGFVSDAIACLDYVLELKQNQGINIVATNNSWGSTAFSAALYNAIAAHYQAGILFVASAGNDDAQAPFYPAAFDLPNIISVSAHAQDGSKADFANVGRSWVDISAPGVAIYSTDLQQQYSLASGTSMAAPVLTGVASLVSAAEPGISLLQLKARLLLSGMAATDNTLADKTVSGKMLLASGTGQTGALQCVDTILQRRIAPATELVYLSAGDNLDIQVLSLGCDGSTPAVSVTAAGQALALFDNGSAPDAHAGDGIFNGRWLFDGNETTLQFPDGAVQIRQRNNSFCQANTVTEIALADCDALVELYYDTQGQDWLISDNWLLTNTPCSWHGISCSAGRVSAIELIDNNLTGQLPAALNQLSALTSLDVSGNSLEGSFPQALLQLTKLQSLILWQNAFDGSLPPALANLTELQRLDVSENRFSGSLPSGLGNLVNLQQLYLESNQFSGNLPLTLGQLSQLQLLWVFDNGFSGTMPANLADLQQMQRFAYDSTDLCPPVSPQFSSWLGQISELSINTDCPNTAPVVSAGDAQQVLSGAAVQLQASATDAEFTVLQYQWQQLEGPTVSLSNSDTLSTSFSAPVVSSQTQLRFLFSATDGIASSNAEVVITVRPVATGGGSGNNAGGESGGGAAGYGLLCALLLLWRRRVGKPGQSQYNG